MAVPTAGLLENYVPTVRHNGLNTALASNQAGHLIDTSGNTTIPGTLAVTGAATFTGAVTSTGLNSGPKPIVFAAATLTAAQSGAICIFNNAAGFTYTLPTPVLGLDFTFIVSTTVTSSVARVACTVGAFFLGTILQATDGTYTQAAVSANGTTHLAWEGNGSTTGGIIGDWFTVRAISTTQWAVYGANSATGTEATPWKTS